MGLFKSFFKALLEPTPTNYSMNKITELPNTVGEQVLTYKYTNEICIINNNHKFAMSNIGQPITFIKEPNNKADPHAVAIYLKGQKIGYVYRSGNLQNMINGWLKKNEPIFAFISGYRNSYGDIIVEYTIGFYTHNGRTKTQSNALKSKKVNFFTKKWSQACKKEYVSLDFETTGLDYKKDKIIEIAAIKYRNGIETDKLISLVNPQRNISKAASNVNHITDDMVASSPTENEIIPKLIEFLSNSLIVGHKISFDLRFLETAAQKLNLDVQYNYVDTLEISRKLFPDLVNHKLETISKKVGFNSDAMHRAETDVKACSKIIEYAINNFE